MGFMIQRIIWISLAFNGYVFKKIMSLIILGANDFPRESSKYFISRNCQRTSWIPVALHYINVIILGHWESPKNTVNYLVSGNWQTIYIYMIRLWFSHQSEWLLTLMIWLIQPMKDATLTYTPGTSCLPQPKPQDTKPLTS